MTKVRILLDVDGVLNAVPFGNKLDPCWSDWKTVVCMGFPITFSETVGKRLQALIDTPEVEFLWLTTWCDDANKWIRPLFGWPTFEVAGRLSPNERENEWWKLTHARRLWEQDKIPFVWIDDDLGFRDDGASGWINSLEGQALGIRPNVRVGLTPKLLDNIEEFVTKKLADG